jgi:hypothetical protein
VGPRIFLILLLVGSAVAGVVVLRKMYATDANPPLAELPQQDRAAAPPRATWVGSASCAAAVCHGGGGPRDRRGNEFDTWSSADPHAHAFAVLRLPRSEAMVRHLQWRPAHEEPRCLRCHVQSGFDPDLLGPQFDLESGVSCESCHGAAGRWIDRHYHKEWQQTALADKEMLGLVDTKTLGGRARQCAVCHVGGPGAEVDHDLIAAGHPALRFEFASYLANLPPHWDVAKDRRREAPEPDIDPRGWSDFEARAWLIGQAESARAALELVAARGPKPGPWPEFSWYNCFACHHDLSAPDGWRQERALTAPGRVIPWQTWYLALLPRLMTATGKDTPLRDELAGLRTVMESRRGLQPAPPGSAWRTEVCARAGRLAELVRDWGRGIEGRAVLPIADLDAAVHAASGADWDEATQIYLARAALRRGGGDPTLLQRLRFPQGFDSPRDFLPPKK